MMIKEEAQIELCFENSTFCVIWNHTFEDCPNKAWIYDNDWNMCIKPIVLSKTHHSMPKS